MTTRRPDRSGFFDRQRIVAGPHFNRWLIPPAALAIHLSIGTAYGFSVFLQPLTRVLGIAAPLRCAGAESLWRDLVATGCDWRVSDLGWVYTLFFVFLGTAAAVWGGWLERAGPRRAGLVAALCWSSGQLIAAVGIACHQLWLLWLGLGAVGGIGLGLGYILPVSILIRWFPDRRGIAGGLAVMGFGGGAMIGAPLSNLLMGGFRTARSVGAWQTFVVLALLYLAAMIAGAVGFRLPPEGWSPARAPTKRTAAGNVPTGNVPAGSVPVRIVHRSRQFWLLWSVLGLNVSAGIGMLGVAALMLQELFGGQLLGRPGVMFAELGPAQRAAAAGIAAGFTGLLSLFNIAGRLFWAALSDRIGRRAVFRCFSVLGIAFYAVAPAVARSHDMMLFVGLFCLLISQFGGAFATMPAYVADIFGPAHVGAIQGRILTAWSVAGIVGPVLVNYMREAQLAGGVPASAAYDLTLYILAGMLAVALVANEAVRPLAPRWFAGDASSPSPAAAAAAPVLPSGPARLSGRAVVRVWLLLAWSGVGLPLAWGVWMTAVKTLALFGLHGPGN